MSDKKRKKSFAAEQKKEAARQSEAAKKAKIKNIVFLAVSAVLICALAFGIVYGIIAIVDSQRAKDYCEYANTREFDTKKVVYADIKIKDYGTVRLLLDKEAAPDTVNNFVSLAESGFYDGLTFYKAMEDYKLEGGCPNGDGSGYAKDEDGNKITVEGEFSKNNNAGKRPIKHIRGVISMARDSGYNSASSRFFICTSNEDEVKNLDGYYASFGYVIFGMRVIDEIMDDVDRYAAYDGIITDKDKQPVIESIKIIRSGITPGTDNETEPDIIEP